jgi:hypothetical protein
MVVETSLADYIWWYHDVRSLSSKWWSVNGILWYLVSKFINCVPCTPNFAVYINHILKQIFDYEFWGFHSGDWSECDLGYRTIGLFSHNSSSPFLFAQIVFCFLSHPVDLNDYCPFSKFHVLVTNNTEVLKRGSLLSFLLAQTKLSPFPFPLIWMNSIL